MTREQWDALSPKGRWDIIVAQRGPDSKGGETLKWFTCSVIRAEVGQILRAWGGSALVNDDLKAVILPEGKISGKKGIDGFDWAHYTEHIYQAAHYLQLPVGTIPGEVYYAAVSGNYNLYQAADQMLKNLDERLRDYAPFKELIRHRDQYLRPRFKPATFDPDIDGWIAKKKAGAE